MEKQGLISNNRGQVALILIFVAAIALILYAMACNVAKLSSTKLLVTIAGNTSAAGLASKMASYGENVMQTQLGGRREKCDYTSLLSAVIGLIIVIIIVVIMIVAHQYELASVSIGIAGSATLGYIAIVAAVVLAVAAVVVQAVYVQPMITKMWNKMQAQIETTEDQFLEGTLQAAIQHVVSDQVMIRDFYDYNMDDNIAKRWGPYDTSDYHTWQTVPRFSYYYTKRLESYRKLSLVASNTFLGSVNALLSGVGLNDRGNCCQNQSMNQELCDKCCVMKESRQSSCHPDIDDPALYPDVPSQCNSGPYPGYPLSYDILYCNRRDPTTLPGLLGRDDNNLNLRKTDMLNPDSDEVADIGGGPLVFRGEDSEGRLFPLLWMARDGVAYIRNLTAASVTTSSKNCHWCAASPGAAPLPVCDSALDKNTYRFWYYPVTKMPYGQLVLTRPCSGDTCCTNRFNADPYFTVFTPDTRAIDEVGLFDINIFGGCCPPNGLFEAHPPAPPNDCPGTDGLWRGGGDDFCSTTPPYYMGTAMSGLCAKYTGGTMALQCLNPTSGFGSNQCDCSQSGRPEIWFDDSFDNFIHWMRAVTEEIYGIIRPNGRAATAESLSSTVSSWRNGAFEILNAIDGCTCNCNGNGRCVNVGACSGSGIYDMLTAWQRVFDDWLNDIYTDEGPGPLFCLPSNIGFLPAQEQAYVTQGGVPYGSVRSILYCLEYNSNIVPKLQACKAFCDANPSGTGNAACLNLPRSVLLPPGTDLSAIFSGAMGCSQMQNFSINGAPVFLPFRDIITMALRLAYDEEEKMKKRHEYLYNLYEYVRTMREGLNTLKAPLAPGAGSPVQNIKDAICSMEEEKHKGQIENVVYYGWCTDWDPGDFICSTSGRWHLARAEAWLPKRCDGFQGGNGCCTNTFPWVKTEKSGAFKRCYFMQAHSGRVRVRVLRYDAPTGATGRLITFANGFPLWQFKESNPYSNAASLTDLWRCQNTDLALYYTIAPGAFMLNGVTGLQQKNGVCQNAVVEAMNRAVGNETCAYYYLDGNGVYHMRFGRCDNACEVSPDWH